MSSATVSTLGGLLDVKAAENVLGTGTPVGDPIEVKAISNGMNERRSREQPLLLGAVSLLRTCSEIYRVAKISYTNKIKANIGHSEAASGIFAVIKAALILESGVIPGVAGLKTLNPARSYTIRLQ